MEVQAQVYMRGSDYVASVVFGGKYYEATGSTKAGALSMLHEKVGTGEVWSEGTVIAMDLPSREQLGKFEELMERRRHIAGLTKALNADVVAASAGRAHHQGCNLGGLFTGLGADASGSPCWCIVGRSR